MDEGHCRVGIDRHYAVCTDGFDGGVLNSISIRLGVHSDLEVSGDEWRGERHYLSPSLLLFLFGLIEEKSEESRIFLFPRKMENAGTSCDFFATDLRHRV